MPTNWGAVLSGMGNGVAPYLNQAAERNRQQDADRQQVQALMRALQQQGGGQQPSTGSPAPGQSPVPPQMPSTSGISGAPTTPRPPGMAMPAGGPPTGQLNGAGPSSVAGGGMQDMNRMMMAILSAPGGDDGAKLSALKTLGALETPLEKMQNQLQMASEKLANQQAMLDERSNTLVQLQQMRNTQSGANNAATNQTKKDISDKNRQQSYDKMSGVDLRGELTSITQELTNNPKLTSEERKDLQAQWQAAKNALDAKRKTAGLPPDKASAPARPPDEQVKAVSGGIVPPQEAVDALKASPDTASQFDEIFGVGASKKVLGQ